MDIVKGNLFDTTCDIIAHQTNCLGLMGSGVALQVKNRFSKANEEYIRLCQKHRQNPSELLGCVQVVQVGDKKYIANVFSQCNINKTWYLGGKVTDYAAIEKALKTLKGYMLSNGLKTLAIPYKFGCVRGGGKWEEVEQIFDNVLLPEIHVTAYEL